MANAPTATDATSELLMTRSSNKGICMAVNLKTLVYRRPPLLAFIFSAIMRPKPARIVSSSPS
jgi:hypothetical protein